MSSILRAESVSKWYGATPALSSVNFSVEAGAVNVLIGENGAGKSTLMRILAGVERPSEGLLLLDGQPISFSSVRDATASGIGIVHQELNLCPNLSIAENIYLVRGPGGHRSLLDKAAERKGAQKLLAALEQDIDPDTPVSELRVGQQQIVEIAKALADDCRILIMDEPTSALSAAEVDVLFRVIDRLRRSGVAIIYISHRLEELLRIGDRITVMRDGRVVETADVADIDLAWIVDRMLGETGKIERQRGSTVAGPVSLSVNELALPRGSQTFGEDTLSAEFRSGEITAVYGLLGAGRTELFELICGARPSLRGTVHLNGEPLDGLGVAARVRRGLLLVPEDRQREGVFANLSVGSNMSLADLARFKVAGMISALKEMSAITHMVEKLTVKTPTVAAAIGALSGGNQQKVVIGRALMPGPSVLLLDEPSRGIDVGARAEVFSTMQRLAAEGLTVIFSTSDLTEVALAADRVLVMANGRITLDVATEFATETMLVEAANAVTERTGTMVQ